MTRPKMLSVRKLAPQTSLTKSGHPNSPATESKSWDARNLRGSCHTRNKLQLETTAKAPCLAPMGAPFRIAKQMVSTMANVLDRPKINLGSVLVCQQNKYQAAPKAGNQETGWWWWHSRSWTPTMSSEGISESCELRGYFLGKEMLQQ